MGKASRNWMISAVLLAAAVAVSGSASPASVRTRTVSNGSMGSHTLSVSITPNGSVPAHSPCHFTATVSGGSGSYHYAWAVNNSPVGGDFSVIVYTNNGSPFRIDVNVTDANTADTGSDSNIMTIGGSCF